ncbi:hypothetical protein F4801DRAFT_589630 [Xylaria longipes]|nr:hypothetical protein F4801DRAFT_589630 [Xylaria longipes]
MPVHIYCDIRLPNLRLGVGSPSRDWIEYQILIEVDLGFSLQASLVISTLEDLSTRSAMALFFQWGGSAVCLAVAQSLFSNRLVVRLERAKSIDAAAVNWCRRDVAPNSTAWFAAT